MHFERPYSDSYISRSFWQSVTHSSCRATHWQLSISHSENLALLSRGTYEPIWYNHTITCSKLDELEYVGYATERI